MSATTRSPLAAGWILILAALLFVGYGLWNLSPDTAEVNNVIGQTISVSEQQSVDTSILSNPLLHDASAHNFGTIPVVPAPSGGRANPFNGS